MSTVILKLLKLYGTAKLLKLSTIMFRVLLEKVFKHFSTQISKLLETKTVVQFGKYSKYGTVFTTIFAEITTTYDFCRDEDYCNL